MKISLYSSYKSIPAFDSIDLPKFTVIVGLNGTGKSQLLEAINSGRVDCNLLEYQRDLLPKKYKINAVLLTNISLDIQSKPISERISIYDKISKQEFDKIRNDGIDSIDNRIIDIFKNTGYKNLKTGDILNKTREDIIEIIEKSSDDGIKKYGIDNILSILNSYIKNPGTDVSLHSSKALIYKASEHLGIEPRLLTFDNVNRFGSWGEQNMFDSQLPKLFHGYRADLIANNRKSARNGRPADSEWLDAEAFQRKFGAPPWEKISSIMKRFDLNYRIAPPGLRDIDQVGLHFEILSDEDNYVEFHSLSAGEKVLILLSIALMDIDPFRATIRQPSLLLLDEIDASLHPAVLHQWMTTIQDKIVERMGIPCIMTTHSPVTVSLAPEESLFEMRREKIPLSKISMHEALNKLTIGLPSMDVDFTQRRQIFVEAEVDAQAYDLIYTYMKPKLGLHRSLNFLSTGIRNKQGVEQGTGCTAVEKVVNELADFGNLSTFGLLDWDGTRTPKGRIHVLAQGTHYAFDNIILHPLLIGALLIRHNKPPAKHLPPFVGIDRLEADDLQKIADAVQSQLTYPDGASKKKIPVQFIDNTIIMTHEFFCQSNGHKMEEILAAAFPFLQKFTKRKGKLALAVIKEVLGDCPNFCPQLLAEIFRELSDAEA